MLKLPHISKPISHFGWIISDSNNQKEILFLIVYTKKTRYGANERKNTIFRIGYYGEEEKKTIQFCIKSAMTLAERDNCNLRRPAVDDAFSNGRPALMNGC